VDRRTAAAASRVHGDGLTKVCFALAGCPQRKVTEAKCISIERRLKFSGTKSYYANSGFSGGFLHRFERNITLLRQLAAQDSLLIVQSGLEMVILTINTRFQPPKVPIRTKETQN
jgi:hypothetical protein